MKTETNIQTEQPKKMSLAKLNIYKGVHEI